MDIGLFNIILNQNRMVEGLGIIIDRHPKGRPRKMES
jgi:hypothetical protein